MAQREPPLSTPEQIELYGKKQPRPLLLDANVVAYFADLMRPRTHMGSRQAPTDRRSGAPALSQSALASAQSHS